MCLNEANGAVSINFPPGYSRRYNSSNGAPVSGYAQKLRYRELHESYNLQPLLQ